MLKAFYETGLGKERRGEQKREEIDLEVSSQARENAVGESRFADKTTTRSNGLAKRQEKRRKRVQRGSPAEKNSCRGGEGRR